MALRHAAAAAAARLQPTAARLQPTAARLSTLEKEARALQRDYIVAIEEMKETLYDLMSTADRHRLIGGYRSIEYSDLLLHLSAHIKPRPHDLYWRRASMMQSIRYYTSLAGSCCLGFVVVDVLDCYIKAAKELQDNKQLLQDLVNEGL